VCRLCVMLWKGGGARCAAGTRSQMRRWLCTPSSASPTSVHNNTWFTARSSDDTPNLALLLLNTPQKPASALRQLWSLATYRVCADAAANRLHDSFLLSEELADGVKAAGSALVTPASMRQQLYELERIAAQHESMVPDAVTGDFDSIRADVLQFYKDRGCLIAHDSSQDSTDFGKALGLIGSLPQEDSQSRTVVALGAFGDRFDHELASINMLYMWQHRFERIILMGERMTATLLPAGRHKIIPNPLLEGPTCGLLPIGGACERVSTKGLRWNLVDQPLGFGGMVSSSNEMVVEADGVMQVIVETSHPLVWTTVLRPDGWPRSTASHARWFGS